MRSLSKISTDPTIKEFPSDPKLREKLIARESTLFESFENGLNMYESELMTQVKEKNEIDDLAVQYPEESVLSIDEIQAKYDFKAPKPLTERQVILSKSFLTEELARAEKFSETGLQLSDPLNTVATWIGAGIGMQGDLANIAADLLLLNAPPLLGLKKLGQFTKLAKYAAKMNDKLKKTKLATQIKNVKFSDDLVKQANRLKRIGKQAIENDKIRSLTRVGTANALVELGIHHVEATKGNHYDIGPAIAMGVFAPVFLRGAGAGLSAGGRGVKSVFRAMGVKKAPKVKAQLDLADIQKKIKEGKPLDDLDVKRIKEYDPSRTYAAQNITDPLQGEKRWADLLDSDTVEDLVAKLDKYDDAVEAVGELKAIQRGEEVFGETYSKTLTEAAAGMIRSNHRVDPISLWPWMKNRSQWNSKLNEVKQKRHGKGWKDAETDAKDLENMLQVTEEQFQDYHAKHEIAKPTREKIEAPEKVQDIKKRQEAALTEALSSKNPETGTFAKDLLDSFSEFRACAKRGGKNVNS